MVLTDQMAMAEARGWPAADIALLKADILAQGPTASLQGAVFSVFLRSSIIASMALADFHLFQQYFVHDNHQFPHLLHRTFPSGCPDGLSQR